jgi:hypothetical protein
MFCLALTFVAVAVFTIDYCTSISCLYSGLPLLPLIVFYGHLTRENKYARESELHGILYAFTDVCDRFFVCERKKKKRY